MNTPTAAAIARVRDRWIGASPTLPSSSSDGTSRSSAMYATAPRPPKNTEMPNPIRKIRGSTSKYLPRPRRHRPTSGPSASAAGVSPGAAAAPGLGRRLRLGHLVGRVLVVHRLVPSLAWTMQPGSRGDGHASIGDDPEGPRSLPGGRVRRGAGPGRSRRGARGGPCARPAPTPPVSRARPGRARRRTRSRAHRAPWRGRRGARPRSRGRR